MHDVLSMSEGKVYLFRNETLVPAAGFNPDALMCIDNVTFTDASNAIGTVSWQWDFGPNATPQTATGAGPHSVSYSSDSAQVVTLIVSNPAGSDTTSTTVLPMPLPIAAFALQAAPGITVNFVNASTNATSYLWDFGDLNQSTLDNPSHTYASEGTYTVVLEASNDCGTNDTSLVITITEGTSIRELQASEIQVYPNPAQDFIELRGLKSSAMIELLDVRGRLLYAASASTAKERISIAELPAGVYLLRVSGAQQHHHRIVKR